MAQKKYNSVGGSNLRLTIMVCKNQYEHAIILDTKIDFKYMYKQLIYYSDISILYTILGTRSIEPLNT